MYEDMFRNQPGVDTNRFLLSKTVSGNVLAERIESASDARLRSNSAFAFIAVDTFEDFDGELVQERRQVRFRDGESTIQR